MQVFFKDGSELTVTEILGSRITGKDAAGNYTDKQLRDVTRFYGRVVFYASTLPEQYVDGGPEAQPVAHNPAAIDYNSDTEEAEYTALVASLKKTKTA